MTGLGLELSVQNKFGPEVAKHEMVTLCTKRTKLEKCSGPLLNLHIVEPQDVYRYRALYILMNLATNSSNLKIAFAPAGICCSYTAAQ